MPLKRGKGKKGVQAAVSENIKELYHANEEKPPGKKRSRQQILAIAESSARGGKKRGKR